MELTEKTASTAISIKNVLFATDFSPASEAALPYAIAISRRYGSTLHAAHVVSEAALARSGGWVDPSMLATVYENMQNEAREKMHGLSSRLGVIPHHVWVCSGLFWDALAGIISEHQVDLLVAGTHGRTGVNRLLMGSMAEEILRHARCPVLTVGPKVSESREELQTGNGEPPEVRFRRILYATDFTPESLAARPLAISLAQEFQARLTLLHVIGEHTDPNRLSSTMENAKRRLEGLVSKVEGLPQRPAFLLEFGSPAEGILETAKEQHADLIVLGVRPLGYMGLATHIPWTTAPKVVGGALCPVLTIRG